MPNPPTTHADSQRPDSQRRSRRDRSPPRPPTPLTPARLEEQALAYVARFATSEGKLRAFLRRKLRQRGWEAGEEEDRDSAFAEGAARIEALVERFATAGYVDDESFARGRTGGLLRRGFGARRIAEDLGAAGIGEDLRAAVAPGEGAQRRAALALARKRRFGPFGDGADDPARRQKQLSAMLRAGHGMDSARRLVSAGSPEEAESWAAEADDQDDGNRDEPSGW
jgi:regulatory protein